MVLGMLYRFSVAFNILYRRDQQKEVPLTHVLLTSPCPVAPDHFRRITLHLSYGGLHTAQWLHPRGLANPIGCNGTLFGPLGCAISPVCMAAQNLEGSIRAPCGDRSDIVKYTDLDTRRWV